MAALPGHTATSGSAQVEQPAEASVAAECAATSRQAAAQMTADAPTLLKPCVDACVMASMQRLRAILAGTPSKAQCQELEVHLQEAHAGIRKMQKQANRAVRDSKGTTVWTGQVQSVTLEYQDLRDYAEEWQHHANLKTKGLPASREMSTEDGVETPSFALRESLAMQEKRSFSMGAMKRHPSEPAMKTTRLSTEANLSQAEQLNTSCTEHASELFVGRVREESRKRPVELAMYDLSRGLAKWVPAVLLDGNKFEALWHTGVRVFGFEFWFGGDIIQAIPDVMPFGDPVRIVRLGMTQRKYKELRRFIRDELAVVYTRQSYDALRQNCNHFSNEVVRFLLHGKQIPEEVRTQLEWCRDAGVIKVLRPVLNRWLGGMPDKAETIQPPAPGDLGLAPGAYPIVHPSLSPKLFYDERFCLSPKSVAEDSNKPRRRKKVQVNSTTDEAVGFSSSEEVENSTKKDTKSNGADVTEPTLHMPMEL